MIWQENHLQGTDTGKMDFKNGLHLGKIILLQIELDEKREKQRLKLSTSTPSCLLPRSSFIPNIPLLFCTNLTFNMTHFDFEKWSISWGKSSLKAPLKLTVQSFKLKGSTFKQLRAVNSFQAVLLTQSYDTKLPLPHPQVFLHKFSVPAIIS